MIQLTNPNQCCGCTACESICGHKAITMQPDALGFLYPQVDQEKCTECGLCEKVCAFHANYDTSLNLAKPEAYAARHKNMAEIETSRSGAAFIALSDWILEQGGVVYGAGYADHFRVVHKRATTKEERNEFKGSKYVQSDLNNTFKQVKQDLKNGLYVLYSGTPCQTSGLLSYIGNRLREKLYIIDIVCHGVPSPYIWRDYLSYLEKKEGKKITAVNFRDKQKFGWAAHRESFKFNDTQIHTYNYKFYSPIALREACGICPFANTIRPSDITIADFWGWEKTDSEFNKDDKGCSLVLCNTEKGKVWFDSVKKEMNYIKTELEKCMQPNMSRPSSLHNQRLAFRKDYQKRGFVYVMKRYGNVGWFYKLRRIKHFLVKLKNSITKK